MWGSCFSLGSRRSPPSAAAAPHSSLLITHSLITHSLTPSLTHYSLTHSPSLIHSLTHSSSLTHCTHSLRQAQYRELAFCVADALHRASWRSCGARGRRWGRGCLSRGRRSTQSLLDELRRAWPPLGPRLPLAWQAQYTEPPGRAAARVAGAAAAFRVAGAVHRASWRSCGARGRRWGRGCLLRGRRSTQSLHIIFDTLSFSHKFVSHHLSDTILYTPTLRHHLSHHLVPHHLSHTTLSHTILHKPLCHTLSFTHHFVPHHLSHPICDTPSLSALCHKTSTPSFTHHL